MYTLLAHGLSAFASSVRKLNDVLARECDVLVTMGCGEECPVVPGLRVVDWEIEDPKGRELDRVRRIRDDVDVRVQALLSELASGQK